MEMPKVAPLKSDDPFVAEVMGFNLETIFDYHLHVDVTTMDDEAVDRLDDMWSIHRDHWLGRYGLMTAVEPGERGHDHLVVHDSRMTAVTKIPSGLSPSDERMWLKTNPTLHSRLQTVDERFEEDVALFFDPEQPSEMPNVHPEASLFRGIVKRLFHK
jgi:hypothetical protein